MRSRVLGVSIFLVFFIVGIHADYNYCQAPPVTPSVKTNGMTLKLLQGLSRHGDRTPAGMIPTTADPTPVFWNCTLTFLEEPGVGFAQSGQQPSVLFRKAYIPDRELLLGNCAKGQLTEIGLKQTQAYGSQLRSLYVDTYKFLPQTWQDGVVKVRSTDVPRTIQSAQGQLLGLYPPFNPSGSNIPYIQINTMDIDNENLFANSRVCPKYKDAMNALTQSTEWKQKMAEFAAIAAKLQSIYGDTPIPSLDDFFDAFNCRVCHKLPLPKGVTQDLFAQIQAAGNWESNYTWNNPDVGKFGMGPFLGEVLKNFDDFIAGKTGQIKYFLFSAHDTSVGPFMGVLGLYPGMWPPYISNAQFELWQNNTNSRYYVQMKYNGNVVKAPFCQSEMCDYISEWRPFIQTRVPTPAECGL